MSTNDIVMKPSQVVSAIKSCFAAKLPFFIHGQPGAGKSDVVRQAADELGAELRDVRASQLESVDLRGLPYIEGGFTKWSFPNFLPPMYVLDDNNNLVPNEKSYILFLDELNQASQSTQAASYQLILDRRLGDYILPKNCIVVAAGNRSIDRAIVNKMGSALKNRFVHANIVVDADEWLSWASKAGIHPSIVGYINYRRTSLNDLGAVGAEGKKRMEAALEGNAFATPRSWAFASRIIYAQPERSIEHNLLAGTIGEAVLADFLAFLRVYRDLPDLDKVLANPEKAAVPTDTPVLYALTSGLAEKVNKTNIGNAFKYLARIPAEFRVMCVKQAQLRDMSIVATPEYAKFLADNSSVL